jgi:hypothetical protein
MPPRARPSSWRSVSPPRKADPQLRCLGQVRGAPVEGAGGEGPAAAKVELLSARRIAESQPVGQQAQRPVEVRRRLRLELGIETVAFDRQADRGEVQPQESAPMSEYPPMWP